MKRGYVTLALLIAVAGCTAAGSGDGGNGIAAVQPSQVSVDDLQAAATTDELRSFYEARQWQPAWNVGNAQALIEAIGEAPRHGLDPATFLGDLAENQIPAAREVALSHAALAYARALALGRADPRRLREIYTLPRPDTDIAAGLGQTLEGGGNVADWLNGLAPQDDEYRRLSEAYVAAREQADGAQPREAIPAGRTIQPGGADPRLPAIAAALAADGYLERAGEAPARLDPELAAAVRRVQEDYGLTANGAIDTDTLAAINEGAIGRMRALAVNLDRRRWLAREAPATRIDVNTAAAMLTYWREGSIADRRRAVVGEPGTETPELGSPLYRLVANPTWTVPRSIEQREIAPRGAGYMRRNNMEWRDGWIVQRSGPTNSLGLVKFDMQNDHAIYLHDTPAKALFDEGDRHRSHGCVRVQDALGFAAMIAEQEGVRAEWERARAGGDEAFVPLPRPIPVRLMYQTAFVDDGRVRYRLDAYGWDDAVANALGLAERPARTLRERRGDIGP